MKDSQKLPKKKRYFKIKNKNTVTAGSKPANQSSGKLSSGKFLSFLRGRKSSTSIKNKKRPKASPIQLTDKSLTVKEENFFLKKHETNLVLFFIPLILLVILGIVHLINSKISLNIQKNILVASSDINFLPYPVLENSYEPYLSSKAAIVIDSDSQTILFEKNPHLRFSLASTAKIMTALTALDYYSPDSILTVNSGFTEGSGLNLHRGDKFYFQDLLYAMMLPSANDAASAIADNYPGGRKEFVLKMNEKAAKYHLTDTHFSDPVGFDDDGNYSTVIDLARLASVAIKNNQFAKIVSTKQKYITNLTNTHPYNLYNLNRLLGIHGVNGIKTGTTEGAGEVLVTSAIINNHTFVIIVMNSQDRYGDTSGLLTFIENSVRFADPKADNSNL